MLKGKLSLLVMIAGVGVAANAYAEMCPAASAISYDSYFHNWRAEGFDGILSPKPSSSDPIHPTKLIKTYWIAPESVKAAPGVKGTVLCKYSYVNGSKVTLMQGAFATVLYPTKWDNDHWQQHFARSCKTGCNF